MIRSYRQKIVARTKKIWKAAFTRTYIYPFDKYFYHHMSFSLEGEDSILTEFFGKQKEGFYVDVGAHHPQRFSNTYKFYLKGWRGINIDAMPESMDLFRKFRPGDINLEIAISNSPQLLTYYMFEEPAYNSFSEELVSTRKGINLLDKKKIKTQRLSSVLEQYLPSTQKIDFLSVDVEGLDYQVLLSNDWSKYRPRVVLVEDLEASIEASRKLSEIECFLQGKGYQLFARTIKNSLYKDMKDMYID